MFDYIYCFVTIICVLTVCALVSVRTGIESCLGVPDHASSAWLDHCAWSNELERNLGQSISNE